MDLPLHVYIEAETEEQVAAAAAKVEFLITPSEDLDSYKAKPAPQPLPGSQP